MDRILGATDDSDTLVTGNELIKARTSGVGVIPCENAIAYGLSGPEPSCLGRGIRPPEARNPPALRPVDFDVVSAEGGDGYDRYVVRLQEIRGSVKIVRQAIEKRPPRAAPGEGAACAQGSQAQVYVRAENPKGEFGYYIISQGGHMPYRVKIRSASFSNISLMSRIAKGALVPDLVAAMGSLDFVLGDVDR